VSEFHIKMTPQLEHMLEYISERLGIASHNQAELLRELATLGYWVVFQSENGFTIQAQKGDEVQRLEHHLLHQLLQQAEEREEHVRITLLSDEVERLEKMMHEPIALAPALDGVLRRISRRERTLPTLQWIEPQ